MIYQCVVCPICGLDVNSRPKDSDGGYGSLRIASVGLHAAVGHDGEALPVESMDGISPCDENGVTEAISACGGSEKLGRVKEYEGN